MLSDEEYDDLELDNIGKTFKNKYDGERNENGERHGFGRAQFSNGDSYAGQYENGLRGGFGKYTFRNRGIVFASYEGEYKDNRRKGKGTMRYPDGSSYSGEWEDSKRHGQGVYTYVNGDYYDGEWKEGRKHGKGVYVFARQGIMYDGMWEYDRFEGKGELVTNCFIFSGSFSEQESLGEGRYEFDNLCAQHGEYVMKRVLHTKGEFHELGENVVPTWVCTSLTHAPPRDKLKLLISSSED